MEKFDHDYEIRKTIIQVNENADLLTEKLKLLVEKSQVAIEKSNSVIVKDDRRLGTINRQLNG